MHTHASKVIVKIFQLGSNSREGNGTLPQYSCLENPTDRGAWWAAVYGDAQSRTRLKRLSSSSRLQQYVIQELPDVQAGFRKGRGPRNQIVNVRWIMEETMEVQKNIYFCFIDYTKALDCVDHNKLWKILKEMGIPDHLTCLLTNLYAGQEATVRTEYRTKDWFQIGKGVRQGCILSPCLFNLYTEYIMQNARIG